MNILENSTLVSYNNSGTTRFATIAGREKRSASPEGFIYLLRDAETGFMYSRSGGGISVVCAPDIDRMVDI